MIWMPYYGVLNTVCTMQNTVSQKIEHIKNNYESQCNTKAETLKWIEISTLKQWKNVRHNTEIKS